VVSADQEDGDKTGNRYRRGAKRGWNATVCDNGATTHRRDLQETMAGGIVFQGSEADAEDTGLD
jgi:hypothetical protein